MFKPTIEESRLIKKQSIKNRIIIFHNFFILPFSLIVQLILPLFGSTVVIPLEVIIYSTAGLNTIYFGANVILKKMKPKEDEEYRPI